MTTHVDAYSVLAGYAVMYRDIQQPIFVRVTKVCGRDPIYTVAARLPHQSHPESCIVEFIDLVDWDVTIKRDRDCWSVVFSCLDRQLTDDERELFKGLSS